MIVVLPAIYVIAAELTSCLIRRSRRPGPKVRRLFPGGRWIRTGSPTLVFLLWIRLKGPTRLLRGAQQRISSAPTPEQLIADTRLEHQIRTWVPSWLPAIAAAGSRRPTASRSSTSVHSPTIRLTTLGGQYRRHQHRLERLSALVLNDHAMTS